MDLLGAPSARALLRQRLRLQNCALPGTVRSSGLTVASPCPSTMGSSAALKKSVGLAARLAEARNCPRFRTRVFVMCRRVANSYPHGSKRARFQASPCRLDKPSVGPPVRSPSLGAPPDWERLLPRAGPTPANAVHAPAQSGRPENFHDPPVWR